MTFEKFFHFVSLSGCCRRLKNFRMQARFLLGPAGSGKTHRCLAEIGAELKASPEGLPLVLRAPKQATFQLERQLLAEPDLPCYSRLQIVSFERLAEFVLAKFPQAVETKPTDGLTLSASKKRNKHSGAQREFPFWEQSAAPPAGSARESASCDSSTQDTFQSIRGPQEFLDEEGRVMVLRPLLAKKQTELRIYRATARLPGFAQQLSLLLRELQRHQQSPEKLFSLATQVDPQLADKLHDLALLLRAYHDWLKTHHLQDADRLLDLATETLRVQTAQPDGSLCLGGLWLDGFAEMTPQELDFLAGLVPLCPRATLAFCLENEPQDLPWLSTWSAVGKTFQQSYQRLSTLAGCEVEVEILQRKRDRGRFTASPVLAHLEANWSRPKPFESG